MSTRVLPVRSGSLSRDGFAVAQKRSVQTMRAAVVSAPGKIEIVEAEIPKLNPTQLLVRLEGCGVCASNISPWEGKPWFTYPMAPGALGHEGWGRVEAVGNNVNDFAPGDRVAMISNNAYAEYDLGDPAATVKLPD